MVLALANPLKLGPAATDPLMTFGTGSPEGVVTAPPGSTYYDKNGGQWEKGRGTGNTGWYQTDNFGGMMNSTNWFMIPHWSVSTGAMVANKAIYVPWYISWPLTIDAVGFEVTTAGVGGSPTVRVGVYDMNSAGNPGNLLKDCGQVVVTATGAKNTTTGQAITIQPGWLFIALTAQGATTTQPTLRTIGNGPQLPAVNTQSTTIAASASALTTLSSTGISAGYASTPTIIFDGTAIPRVQIKPASVP